MLKRKKKDMPAVSTASLPDIIFMLLFFFMVVTVLKSHTVRVNFDLPIGIDLQKIENKSQENHLYIGSLPDGTVTMQLNDAFINLDQIHSAIIKIKNSYDLGEKNDATLSLKVDKNIKMGIVSKVKLELRKADFRKITYVSVREEMEE